MVIPLFKKVQIAKNETIEHYSVLLYSAHEKWDTLLNIQKNNWKKKIDVLSLRIPTR